jgi:hypothetical protein
LAEVYNFALQENYSLFAGRISATIIYEENQMHCSVGRGLHREIEQNIFLLNSFSSMIFMKNDDIAFNKFVGVII